MRGSRKFSQGGGEPPSHQGWSNKTHILKNRGGGGNEPPIPPPPLDPQNKKNITFFIWKLPLLQPWNIEVYFTDMFAYCSDRSKLCLTKVFLPRKTLVLPDQNPTLFIFSQRGSCQARNLKNNACLSVASCSDLFYHHLSRVVRKQPFCENKDADQLCGHRTTDQRLCFRYTDSIIPTSYIQNVKPLAISSDCTASFVSDLVRINNVVFFFFFTLRLICQVLSLKNVLTQP